MTRRRRLGSRRSGFALFAVLWVIVCLAVFGEVIALAASDEVLAAANRSNLLRARWVAEACIERARSAIAAQLANSVSSDSVWRQLDHFIALPISDQCQVDLEPIGVEFDVNDISRYGDAGLRALFSTAGVPAERIDSLVGALHDWIDADDIAVPYGAERAWYAQRGLPGPSNAPIVSKRELQLVRGFHDIVWLMPLGADSARLVLSRAPIEVLAALPGMSAEAIARISESRLTSSPIVDLEALLPLLSSPGREALLNNYAELETRIGAVPDAWLLRSHATRGSPPVTIAVEMRIARDGIRAAVLRRTSWP